MGWDTGAPIWPYETPWVAFEIINAPAVLAGSLVNDILGLQGFGQRLPALLIATLLLWLCVGTAIDRGVFPRLIRTPLGRLCIVGLALASSGVGIALAAGAIQWWSSYGDWSFSGILKVARIIAQATWCGAVTIASILTVISSRQP